MIPDDKLPYHPTPPDDTSKQKRSVLLILKPLGPDDGINAENFPPKFCKTLTGRLLPEDGSVRPQTLGKRISDDSPHYIFRCRTVFLDVYLGFVCGLKNLRKIGKQPFSRS